MNREDARRGHGRIRTEWLLYAAVFMLIGGLTAYTALHSRREIVRLESDRLQVQARVVDENLMQQMEGVDNALVSIRNDYFSPHRISQDHVATQRRMIALTDALPGMRAAHVLDTAGIVVASSPEKYLGRDFAARNYFMASRAHADADTLFVSPPYKSATGVWVLNLTRTLHDAQGAFAGVVTAALDPDYLHVVLRSVLYAADMRTTLVHHDGIVFLGMPPASGPTGDDPTEAGSTFMRHLASGARGTLSIGSGRNGEERMVATRTLQRDRRKIDKPMVVQVSRNVDEVFAAWRRQTQIVAGIIVVVAIFSAAGLSLMQRRRREYQALDMLVRSEREESARRIRTITDNLPALVAYVDRDERYRFVNARYRDVFGIDPASRIGRTIREAVGDATYAQLRGEIDAVLRGEQRHFEQRDAGLGPDACFEVSYVPDRGADGQIAGFYVMKTDISARKRAEMARAASDRRLRDITESIPALIGYCNANERVEFFNGRAARLLKLDAGQTRYTLREALGEASYALHEPHVRTVLSGRHTSFEAESPHLRTRTYFMTHLVPDPDDDGTMRGFYLMTFDVTALKNAELERAQSEQRLRAVTDNLPILISYIDADERFRFLNATFHAWFGLEPALALDRPLLEVVGAERYARGLPYLRRALAGERVEFEFETRTLGSRRSLQIVYVPDVADDGRVAGIYMLSSDVTALKNVERKLSTLARFDTLTGLANRHQLNEKVPEVLARAARSGDALAMMFLDVDHFKAINDSLGHAAGDAVLKEFALRLRVAVRSTDTVARLAGDEFVILLEGLHDEAEPELVARKIVADVGRPFDVAGRLLQVSTSIGVAFHAGGLISPADLLARADAALYHAKAAGRNRFHLVSSLAEEASNRGSPSRAGELHTPQVAHTPVH